MSTMKINWKTVGIAVIGVSIVSMVAAYAAQTNYLGTVFIADPTTPTRQMAVNADGSINATVTGGAVTSISSNGSLSVSGTTAVTVSINPANANVFSVGQSVAGATTTAPGWCASLSADTQPRACVRLDATDVGQLALGPGGSTAPSALLSWFAFNNIRLGLTTDTTAVATGTFSVPNIVAGTTDGVGGTLRFDMSRGTGMGQGGCLVVRGAEANNTTGTTQNALSTVYSFCPQGITQSGSTVSSPAWTTTGIKFIQTAGSLFDTTTLANATVPEIDINRWNAQTLVFNNTNVTVTTLVGTVFKDPACGANCTATSIFSFITDSMAVSGNVVMSGLASDTTEATSRSVCQSTGANANRLFFGSGTLGICKGTSSKRFKRDFGEMATSLGGLEHLHLVTFRYKQGWGDNGVKRQNGLFAEDVAKVWPDCVSNDAQGKPAALDGFCLYFHSLKAQQEMQREIVALQLEHRR